MKKLALIIFTFIMGVNLSLANDFIKGEVYQNHFSDAYGTGVTISFPPGEWKATKVDDGANYSNIDFRNFAKSAYFYLSLPNGQMGGDYFRRGINKCKSKKDNGNLYKVHSTGALRERLAVTYCIQSIDYSDGNTFLNIEIQAQRKKGTPLTWAIYNVYYPIKNSNVENLSKNQLKEIGKSMITAFKNNMNYKSGDFSKIADLLK